MTSNESHSGTCCVWLEHWESFWTSLRDTLRSWMERSQWKSLIGIAKLLLAVLSLERHRIRNFEILCDLLLLTLKDKLENDLTRQPSRKRKGLTYIILITLIRMVLYFDKLIQSAK